MITKRLKYNIVHLYNIVYPEWVMKYKVKGTHVQKKGDVYYLYKVHSKWNKEKGRAQLITDEYLGRITPEGLVEPKYKGMMKRYDQISVKEYGASSLLMYLSEDIRKALKDDFPEWRELFVFAYMRLIHNTPIKNLEFLYQNSYLSEMMEASTLSQAHRRDAQEHRDGQIRNHQFSENISLKVKIYCH